MDENTVFQNPPQNQPQSTGSFLGGTSLPHAPVQAQHRSPSRLPFSIPTLFKALLGFLILAGLGFFIIQFVIPRIAPQKPETVELSYWGLWEGENVMRVVLDDFERENPTIKVSYKKQDIKKYRERLTTQVSSGTGPDIFRFHNTWIPMFSQILLPIPSDVISVSDFKAAYYPVATADLVRNGALYGVPLEIDTLALVVNPDILRAAGVEVPKTWDDFVTASRTLTVKDEQGVIKTAGAAMGTFDNITHASDIISVLFVQNGADINNLSSTPQNAADALSFYTAFAHDAGNVWDETLDPSMQAFAKGNLAMYFGYSWDVFTIKAVNPTSSFQVHPVPHLESRDLTIASYWAEGVSAKSKHQKEAMILMKFLSKKETQQKLYSEASKVRLFGEPYARIGLAESLKDTIIYPFVAGAKNAKSSFFAGDTYDNGLNYQMNGYLGNAVRSMLDNTSVQSAVETLSQGVSQVLQQYSTQ